MTRKAIPVLVLLSCPEFKDRTRTENNKICPYFCPVKIRYFQKFLKFACLRTGQKFSNLVPTSDYT
jgi:hypothetical protein